jgi:uncharacterized protein (TIGR00251 family)
VVDLQIQPGAKKCEVVGVVEGALKIKIQSPPVDGAANEKLIEFLSDTLGIKKSGVEILNGEKSRKKRVVVECSEEHFRRRLLDVQP